MTRQQATEKANQLANKNGHIHYVVQDNSTGNNPGNDYFACSDYELCTFYGDLPVLYCSAQ